MYVPVYNLIGTCSWYVLVRTWYVPCSVMLCSRSPFVQGATGGGVERARVYVRYRASSWITEKIRPFLGVKYLKSTIPSICPVEARTAPLQVFGCLVPLYLVSLL